MLLLFPADAARQRRQRRLRGPGRRASALSLLPLALFFFLFLMSTTTTTKAQEKATREAELEAESAAEASAAAAVLAAAAAAAASGGNNNKNGTDPIAAELAWEAAERQRFLLKQIEEEREEEEEEEQEKEREREQEKKQGRAFLPSPSSSARFSSSSSSPSSSSSSSDGDDPWSSPFEKPPGDLDDEREAEKAAERELELVDRVIGEAAANAAATAARGKKKREQEEGEEEGEQGEQGGKGEKEKEREKEKEKEKEREDRKRDAAAAAAAAPSATLPLSSSSSSPSPSMAGGATKGASAGEPPPPTPSSKDNKKKPPPSGSDVDGDDGGDGEPPPYNPSFPSPVGVGVPRSGGPMLLSETELALSPFASGGGGGAGAGNDNSDSVAAASSQLRRRPLLSLSTALPPLYDPTFGGRGLPAPKPGIPRPPPLVHPPILNSFAAKAEYAAYLRAGFRDDMQAAENERPKPRRVGESSSDGTAAAASAFPPSPLAAVASATRANEYGARTDDIPVVYATKVDVLASAAASRARDGLEASRTVIGGGGGNVDDSTNDNNNNNSTGGGTAPITLSFAANAAVDQPSRRFRPPDQSLCVGNGVVLTGNNLILRTWDAETGAPLQGPIAQPDFFGLDGNFSDPSCIYDAQDTKRFFVSIFRFNDAQPGKYSQFVVAVSKTSDPADGFLGPYVVRNDGIDPTTKGGATGGKGGGSADPRPLPGLERCAGGFSKRHNATAEPGCLGDYPSVGLDAHSLWSGFNLFRTAPLEGYAGTLVVALSKRDLVSGRATSPAAAYYSNFDQTLAYTVQPSQTQPGTPHESSRGGTIYLVSTAPVVQSEPNVPAVVAWAATGTSLLSEDDFPKANVSSSAASSFSTSSPSSESSASPFSFSSASTAAASSASSSSSSPSNPPPPVDPFPGIPRISNAAVVPTPAYRDPGAFKKSKLAVQQPSPGWGLDGGDARTLQHVLSGGVAWTSAQTVMRVGSASAPLSIGPVYFGLLPEWEEREVAVKRRRRNDGSSSSSRKATTTSTSTAAAATEAANDVLFFGGEEGKERDEGGINNNSTIGTDNDNEESFIVNETETTEVYSPKLVAAGYIGAPSGRSIGRPAIVATRTGTAYVAAYMSGSDFAMSPVVAEVDLFDGPQKIMVPALSPVPLEPSNADRLFKAGDPAGGGTLRVGDYSAAVLGDDLRSAWFASEWSGGVPSPACVEQQGPTKCPSWSTYVSRVDLSPEARGGGGGRRRGSGSGGDGGGKDKEGSSSSSSPPSSSVSPTAAERVRARLLASGGGGGNGSGNGVNGNGNGSSISVGKSTNGGAGGAAAGGGGKWGETLTIGGALGEPVAGGEKALAAEEAKKKKRGGSSGNSDNSTSSSSRAAKEKGKPSERVASSTSSSPSSYKLVSPPRE